MQIFWGGRQRLTPCLRPRLCGRRVRVLGLRLPVVAAGDPRAKPKRRLGEKCDRSKVSLIDRKRVCQELVETESQGGINISFDSLFKCGLLAASRHRCFGAGPIINYTSKNRSPKSSYLEESDAARDCRDHTHMGVDT